MTPADIEILASRGVGVAHNPESNMKLASGIAPVEAMRKAGIAVGLGTDGAASNNDLDMFEAMRQAAFLHKLVAGDPRAIPAPVALEMATIGGARAMGMDKEIGSLEPGKRADLLVVSMASARQTPMYDPVSHIVYVTRGDDVRTTIVNGKVLMRDRQRPHPRSASGARRRRSLRREGPRRRQIAHMATTNVLISEADIKQRIVSLAAEIERDYPASDEIHLVAVLKGGFMFMADLVRAMSDRVTMDFMAVSSYGKGTTSSGQVRVLKDLDSNLEGAPHHRRRRHRRYRADAALPAGPAEGARAEVDEDGLPAQQAVAPEGRRAGGLHRLHDRGSLRRRLRPRLRGEVPQPPVHRDPGAVATDCTDHTDYGSHGSTSSPKLTRGR